MSVLPRFPPFRALKGRDYNLIADLLESYLASLTSRDVATSSTVSTGVTSVRGGTGMVVSPATGDVVVTPSGSGGGLPIHIDGSWTAHGGSYASYTDLLATPIVAVANNSIYTIIVQGGPFITGDSAMSCRLTLNGSPYIRGTNSFSGEGNQNDSTGEYIYQFRLFTTALLQAGDAIGVQVQLTGVAAVDGVTGGYDLIRWR